MFAFTRIKHPSFFFYNPALFYLCISLIFNMFIQQINDNSMLNPQTGIKFSDYNSLYDILIPQDSKYRQLNELIDFARYNDIFRMYQNSKKMRHIMQS